MLSQDTRLSEVLERLPLESVLQVTGAVQLRPDGQRNKVTRATATQITAVLVCWSGFHLFWLLI